VAVVREELILGLKGDGNGSV